MEPLINFLDKNLSYENNKYDVKQPSMLSSIENGKTKTIVSYTQTITTKQVRWNNAGVLFKEFKNFYSFPRKSDGKLINGNYNRVWKQNKMIGTITTKNIQKIGLIDNKKELKYRYLTERECWRLMGFSDKDFDNCLLKGLPSTALYKLAGNSIVVNVLEAIFKELLNIINFKTTPREVKYDYLEELKLF